MLLQGTLAESPQYWNASVDRLDECRERVELQLGMANSQVPLRFNPLSSLPVLQYSFFGVL
jgi:hypothetical protein